MRNILNALAIAAFAVAPPAGIAQAQNLTLYKIAGVTDDGGTTHAGTATVVHCTNFTASTQQIRYIVRDDDGSVLANKVLLAPVVPRGTRTAATHFTRAFTENLGLTPGVTIKHGSMTIKATTRKLHCSAMIVDAGATMPTGIALSLTRFQQEKGAQE